MADIILESVVQIVVTLMLTLIGVLGTWLTLKLGKKEELTAINAAKDEVINAANLTVLELQQTVVEGWKAAHEDGKLTKEEIDSLNCQLVSKTLNKLSGPATQILHAAGVDLSGIIHSSAEALIARMKTK